MADAAVSDPFPIFRVGDRNLLYDINTITHVRREHHMCGVLIGNLPQAAQQNVYSGIPLVLMPEEARLLVERGHAYLVDDVAAHGKALSDLKEQDSREYLKSLRDEGLELAQAEADRKDASHNRFLERMSNAGIDSRSSTPSISTIHDSSSPRDDVLFDSPAQQSPPPASRSLQPMLVTPTTSYPPLVAHPPKPPLPLPEVPSAYPLFAHLQSKGYYLSPGLRFGCQYLAYPGDPLRFHSHFLVSGMGWDEEIDLLDVVSGGRLGTGVKKGYLIGGQKEKDGTEENEENVRAFSFEWAVM
jgi:tRNA-splicing endonuclease subunit Sen34